MDSVGRTTYRMELMAFISSFFKKIENSISIIWVEAHLLQAMLQEGINKILKQT